VRLRPGTIADVEAVCALEPAEVTEQDARFFLTHYTTRLAIDAVDRIVGAAGVRPGNRAYASLGVGRAYRTSEIGDMLADWLVRQEPHLYLNVIADDNWTRELVERYGFRRQYPVWRMERSLDAIPAPELPA